MLPVPDFAAIRAAILADMKNLNPVAVVATDSDAFVRASATASAIEGLYQHQQWIARQILPDQADDDRVARMASLYGLALRPAVVSAGSIVLTGTAGALCPAGAEAVSGSGVVLATTSEVVVGAAGSAVAPASVLMPGAAGNLAAGTALTLRSAPPGLSSQAAVAVLSGGADAETPDSLRARLLARLAAPPHGGSAADYEQWAMAVPGVVAAYVYPLRRGPGTVDVVILDASGIPGSALVARVQAYLDSVRPVGGGTDGCWVLAPAAVPVAVTAALVLASGYTLSGVTDSIQTELAGYFAALQPGETAVRNALGAILANTAGVSDYVLTSPAANVAALVDATHVERCTLGTVTLS